MVEAEKYRYIYNRGYNSFFEGVVFRAMGVRPVNVENTGPAYYTSEQKREMDRRIIKYTYPFALGVIKLLSIAVEKIDKYEGLVNIGANMRETEDVAKKANELGIRIPDFYKIQTMPPGAHLQDWEVTRGKPHAEMKRAGGDPRRTKFGEWLSERALDEIAQAINVRQGDISLVGPRLFSSTDLYYLAENRNNPDDAGLIGHLQSGLLFGMTGEYGVGGREQLLIEERVKRENRYGNKTHELADWRFLAMTPRAVLFRRLPRSG